VAEAAAAGGSLAKYAFSAPPPTTTTTTAAAAVADDRSNRFDPGVTAVAGVFARILFYACERPLLSVIIFSKLPRLTVAPLTHTQNPFRTIIFFNT